MPKKPIPHDKWAKRVEQYVSIVAENKSYTRDYVSVCDLSRRGMSVRDAYKDAKASY